MARSKIVAAEGIAPHAIEWFIQDMIPANKLTIIDGDPGQGKSFMTLEIAAALSHGQKLTPKGRRRAARSATRSS